MVYVISLPLCHYLFIGCILATYLLTYWIYNKCYLSDNRWVDSNAYQQITQNTDNVCIEMDLLKVGSEPVGMRCPYCLEDVMTKANYKNTTVTHIIAFILGLFFWWMCCCLVPYFVKRWKNVDHYCPNCRKYLGMYTRSTIL